MKNVQLTSVNLALDVYKKFKIKCIDTGLTLQELVNTSIFLYIEDDEYNDLIHETLLTRSGSVI
jgi:hypothetical protein